jgi:putative Mg2+ transporter-C (MgtC) family protein
MPLHLTWSDIALRLALTVLAGGALGFDRSTEGKPAGIRTTTFVCLAACLAMIQMNLLLPLAGRASDSFIMNDLMRLPLGILTGVGFIGGGAILHRDNMVVGVTTAATLWLATVIGLCFGGGQLGVGIVVTAIALLLLTFVRNFELMLRRDHRASVTVEVGPEGPDEQELRRRLSAAGLRIDGTQVTLTSGTQARRLVFAVRQWRHERDNGTPPEVSALAGDRGIVSVEWQTRS